MKITKVEVMATNVPFRGSEGNNGEIALGKWELCRFVIVKVHTDEGIVGYGESAPVYVGCEPEIAADDGSGRWLGNGSDPGGYH